MTSRNVRDDKEEAVGMTFGLVISSEARNLRLK